MKRLLFKILSVSRIGYICVYFLTIFNIILFIVNNFRRIRYSDILVYYTDGGFGHTITGPDVCRRLWPNKKTLMLFMDKSGTHNPAIALLWQDPVKIHNFPAHIPWLGVFGAMTNEQLNNMGRVIKRLLHWVTPCSLIIDAYDLLKMLSPLGDSHRFNIAYLDLCNENPALPLRLPARQSEAIRNAMGLSPEQKLCSIYLRTSTKGSEESHNRNGSDIDDYTPTINWLIQQGYKILICGDRDLSPSHRARHGAMVLDRFNYPKNHNAFSVFAATEVDLFISEAGGGFWLSTLAGIPTLLVNHFPLGTALPGATVLYKRLIMQSGEELPPLECLRNFTAIDIVGPFGLHPITNTSLELLTATQDFVNFTLSGKPPPPLPDEVLEILRLTMETSMLSHSPGVRLSPAWYK